ncbi:sensor histidine kinase [Spongisporangium articulatum]|uniref:histidine kinase n=1 Tax=Spongisporangium articulatum TaxID=3362603 RepID=A0ABW8ASI5_9ACTN
MSVRRNRLSAALALLVYVLATLSMLAARRAAPAIDTSEAVAALVALPPTVVLGLLVAWRRPDSPVGAGLIWLGASPALAWSLEIWGRRDAGLGADVGAGAWVWNLAGFALLCQVFPDGPLTDRWWRRLPVLFLGSAVLVNTLLAFYTAQQDGRWDVEIPQAVWSAVQLPAAVLFLATLAASVASIAVRYRRGEASTREQLRWLLLGAASVPVLLAAGWVAQAAGASVTASYSGFLIAMLVVFPASVAIAILRHDLLDIDRLISESAAWVATSVVAAGAFAGVVLLLAQVDVAAPGSPLGQAAAAFVAALLLLPVHRWAHGVAGRLFDRERTVVAARLAAFVRAVRDGSAAPESVQDVLRSTLDDPDLLVLLRLPGDGGYVTPAGVAADAPPGHSVVPLTAQGADVGLLVLSRPSARRLRVAQAAVVQVRLPVEVSRLQLGLRDALAEAQAGRARLVEAVSQERRRLERDLHDGAQQQVVAAGMRLRMLQRRHALPAAASAEIDSTVTALEDVVAELRRLAHGVRPRRLDDGLEPALRDLVSTSPIPVTLAVSDVRIGEALATTAYFVVAESLANTLKHAGASAAQVSVALAPGLVVRVVDDGCGGAEPRFGLTTMRDRVTALGGRLSVTSPAGGGTVVEAAF